MKFVISSLPVNLFINRISYILSFKKLNSSHSHVSHHSYEIICLFVCFLSVVCVQASSRGNKGGGCVEKVLRAEEAPRRVGLHAQEPV